MQKNFTLSVLNIIQPIFMQPDFGILPESGCLDFIDNDH